MPTPDTSRSVTVSEAASALGMSARRVRRLLRQGRVPGASQAGRRWLIDRLLFEQYAASAQHGPAGGGPPPAEGGPGAAEAALQEERAARLRAEEALRQERERFARVMDMLPAYLVFLSPDYHVPFANRFFRERFGESEGRRCFEYLFGRSEPCEVCDSYRAIREMRPIRWDWTGPDGHRYDIYDFPYPELDGSTLVMEVGLDVTEQKRAEDALRQAGDYNRSLIEASPDPLVTIGPDGKITDVNAATEAATGHRRDELVGTDFSDYFTEPELARLGYQQVFREGSVRDYALEIRHQDGHTTPVLYNASVYRDDAGQVVGVFAAARDISEQRRAEAARAQLADIVQSSEDAIVAKDLDGTIVSWNQGAARMYGYSAEEMVGHSISVLEPEDQADEVPGIIGRIRQGERVRHYETQRRTKDGRLLTVSLSVSPLRDSSGSIVGASSIARDITERRRVDEALRQAGDYNRSLIEASPDPLVTIGPDGKITDVNAATEAATGHRRDELVGTDFSDYFTEPELARLGYQQVFREGSVRDYALEIRHQDGHTTPVLYNASVYRDDEGEVVGVFAAARDITERKRAEDALRHANETLEDRVAERTSELEMINAALEEEVAERARAEAALAQERERLLVTLRSIGDGVIATDDRGCITLMNPVAETMTGWSEQEAIGQRLRSVFDIRNEATGEPGNDPVATVLATGRVQGLANHTLLVSRDGTRRLLADSAAPIRGDGSSPSGVVLVFQDVTEEQRLEQELAKMNKLESLGILAGGIAHDFNNLLTGILGNIALARMDVAGLTEVGELLGEAEKASARAKSLTQQLLTFAKGGDPVTRSVSLPELLRETTTFSLRSSHCSAEFHLARDLWEVHADPGQLSQVIQNLVINASDAMPTGGTVTVTAQNAVVTSGDALPLTPGDYVRVTVTDHGCGIEPHVLPRVFDPYFTTKPKGSGIGLAVVYSVVVKHDGYVTVDSQPGRGSSFSVYLPSTQHAGRRRAAPGVAVPHRVARALVMDDEETVLRVARRMLERLGYEAVIASHGAEAIQEFSRARDDGNPFSIVILDLYVTGGIGGKETLSRLRELDPGVRAIVCSGYSGDPIMAQYAQHGFSAALDKPFALDSLQEAISGAKSVWEDQPGPLVV